MLGRLSPLAQVFDEWGISGEAVKKRIDELRGMMSNEPLKEQATVRLTLDEKLALVMMAGEDRQSESAWLRTMIRTQAIERGLWPPRPNPRVEVLSEG